jgi:hypothetical protein
MKYEQNTTIVHGAIPQTMTILRGNSGNFLVSNDTYLTVMTYTESYDHTKYYGPALEESGTEGFVIHLMDHMLGTSFAVDQDLIEIQEDFYKGKRWQTYVPLSRRVSGASATLINQHISQTVVSGDPTTATDSVVESDPTLSGTDHLSAVPDESEVQRPQTMSARIRSDATSSTYHTAHMTSERSSFHSVYSANL